MINKIYKFVARALGFSVVMVLLFSTMVIPTPAQAAVCVNATTSAEFPNGTGSVTPDTVKTVSDKVTVSTVLSVTCTVKNPTGWEVYLTGPTATGQPANKNQLKTWTITKWDSSIKSGTSYINQVTISAEITPFSGTPTPGKYNFKYTAYDSNNLSGPTDGFSLTFGTVTPPNNTPGNTPPGNGCTGTGCGTVGSSDFDTNVGVFENPINIESFPELVLFVMKGFIFLIGIMAVLIIIIGGVRMVLSQGNQESITKGKNTIIWAVAGLIVALLSFSLVSIVQNLLSKP